MNIKYVGDRPIINQHGITFKSGKEDKYIYLEATIHILHIIDSKHKKEFDFDIPDDKISIMLREYEPNLEKEIVLEEKNYEEKLKREIESVKKRVNLNELEKRAWINNLKLMQKYRIQRAINKIYYEHSIKTIKRIIKKERITSISVPFNRKYFHVLKSIQSALEIGKGSVNTKIKTLDNADGSMILKFFIFL